MSRAVEATSWEDFLGQIATIQQRCMLNKRLQPRLLFRGQADATWPLITSLERYVKAKVRFSDYYEIIKRIQFETETLTGNRWDIPEQAKVYDLTHEYEFPHLNRDLFTSIYGYMAHLRHHGFPSPILDWTRSPYIAAYFAFSSVTDAEAVSIYVLAEATSHSGSSDTPQITTFGPLVRTHKRHFVQQCEYSLCMRFEDGSWHLARHSDAAEIGATLTFDDEDYPSNCAICKFNLPVTERKKVLRTLEEHNLNAYSLYGSEESLMETLAIREMQLRDRRPWEQQ